MTEQLLYYKPSALLAQASPSLPGTEKLAYFCKLYGAGCVLIDRSGAIKTPIRIQQLFPIPDATPIQASFEDLCNARALAILARSSSTHADIYVLWSGGIDSTLALVSLLKNATAEQRNRLVVLMSEASIREYPAFYRDHIQGKLRRDTATILPRVLGSSDILVSGEHNDQIFGSDAMGTLMTMYGPDLIHQPLDRSKLHAYYNEKTQAPSITDLYLDLYDRLMQKAPFTIVTYFDYVWWVNFALKWQTVYLRTLTYASAATAPAIGANYVRDRYFTFYGTEEFQRWSMTNHDKKIRDTWASYKWVCKDIIFDYTGDAEYRDNKRKIGSLSRFVRHQVANQYVDEHFGLHPTVDLARFYTADHDFN